MVNPELGTKRTCTGCGARFYDLNKSPVVCPKCEHTFIPEVLLPSKEVQQAPAPAAPAAAAPEKDEKSEGAAEGVDVISLDEAAESEDDEIAAIEDVDLGDDDSDIGDDDDDNDAFLEDDDEGDSDVSGIIGGNISGEEEDS